MSLSLSLTPINTREEMRRVWCERVVACGRRAVGRLTPLRTARFGFHGELLEASEPPPSAAGTIAGSRLQHEVVARHRDVILCLSTQYFYILVNHDAVTSALKGRPRKFPLPIPAKATFGDAKWPHALARHSLDTLQAITIGFGFQRLTLRFAKPSAPSSEDHVYVLLTSSKTETISLLREFQSLATEAREAASGQMIATTTTTAESDAIRIENDDPHVLDAIGTAVAPQSIGVVVHYQILHQQ